MTTIDITCKLQQIDNTEHEICLSAFCFLFEDQLYLISVHHGLPIKSCYINNNTDNNVDIYIDCVWNEIIIFKTCDNIPNTLPFIKYQNKIPKYDDTLFIKKDDKEIRLTNARPEFLNLHGLASNPKLLYIKTDVFENSIIKSYSGAPVVTKTNKLVGILSKKGKLDNSAYFIPIYILIKTLIKKDNQTIFSIDYNHPIKKINSTIIKNGLIMHKIMNTPVELDTYYMIEGDCDNTIIVNTNSVNYININNYLYIDNNKELIFDKNKYKLTVRLYKLIVTLYPDLSKQIFSIIKLNFQNKIYVYINKNKLIKKKYYEISNNYINLKCSIDSDVNPISVSDINSISVSDINPISVSDINPISVSDINPISVSDINPISVSVVNPISDVISSI